MFLGGGHFALNSSSVHSPRPQTGTVVNLPALINLRKLFTQALMCASCLSVKAGFAGVFGAGFAAAFAFIATLVTAGFAVTSPLVMGNRRK